MENVKEKLKDINDRLRQPNINFARFPERDHRREVSREREVIQRDNG